MDNIYEGSQEDMGNETFGPLDERCLQACCLVDSGGASLLEKEIKARLA